MRNVLVIVGFLAGLSVSQFTDYNNYKVYHVTPRTQDHIAFFMDLKKNPEVDFWTEPRHLNRNIDLMISSAFQAQFEEQLAQKGIEYSLMIQNVEELISKERVQQSEAIVKQTRNGNKRLNATERYYRQDEINEYLSQLAEDYPNLVQLETAGTSLQGRELTFAKVSSNPGNASRPIILINGGIHAREWISPATVLYILQQLVENEENRDLLENVDWYILPVLNPDGYEFTHTTTRLWRKTRSQGAICFGVDGNRNFDYFWGTVGSSASECAEDYRGPVARSEIETRVFDTFARQYADRIKAYVDFHSYGEYILYPWGYIAAPAENGDELQEVGDAIAAGISAYNPSAVYTVGVASITFYPTSGDTTDYIYGALGVPLSYTIELPSHGYGFLLPVEDIDGVVKETFAGIRALPNYVN